MTTSTIIASDQRGSAAIHAPPAVIASEAKQSRKYSQKSGLPRQAYAFLAMTAGENNISGMNLMVLAETTDILPSEREAITTAQVDTEVKAA